MRFVKINKSFLLLNALLCFAFVSTGQVFPGDANNNGIVNNLDILNIGYTFGTYGPARNNGTDNPGIETVTLLWDNNFPDGLNFAFADADGSGLVDFVDFVSVLVNYGEENPNGSNEQDLYEGIAQINPPLFFERSGINPFLTSGSEIEIPLHLGDDNIPVENFTGIAFTIEYDADLLHDVHFIFEESAWTNEANESFNFSAPIEAGLGKKEIAITRLGNLPLSGKGEIGKFSIIVEDNLVSFLNSPSDSANTIIRITNVKMVNGDFWTVPVATEDIELMIYGSDALPTLTVEPLLQQIRVFPNPTSDILKIESPVFINRVEVMNLEGKFLYSKDVEQQKSIQINTLNKFPAGLYFLKIHTDKGILNRKVVFD